MGKINVENVGVLATTFLLLAEVKKGAVDMSESDFNVCGTIACHAGWFAISRGKNKEDNEYKPYYGFKDSANDMAKFLGFEHKGDLELYFKENPELWGNLYGYTMFYSASAFSKDYSRALYTREPTLREIGNHWAQVYNNLITNQIH